MIVYFTCRFGPRFVDVSEMYDEDLIDIAFEAANEIGLQENVNEGTLAMLGGPTFETPAELRMFKTCGVDAVGKNTQISKNNSSRHIISKYEKNDTEYLHPFSFFQA